MQRKDDGTGSDMWPERPIVKTRDVICEVEGCSNIVTRNYPAHIETATKTCTFHFFSQVNSLIDMVMGIKETQ